MNSYFIVGPNSSGKSILAKEIRGNVIDLYCLNVDEIINKINDDLRLRTEKITLTKHME